MKSSLPLVTMFAMLSGACSSGGGERPPTTSLNIEVAPLTLPGIDFACYDLLIENGASPTRDTVIRRGDPALNHPDDTTTLCSTRFGNATGGDISYVAPCDAQEPSHQITLWVDGLYTLPGGPGSTPEPVVFQDPCPSGCVLGATCLENADTPVTFNLTIMRPALQGFFDVAVNFNNIFCSSKFDTCYSGDPDPTPIELLFGEDGARDWTGVFGFACTAGPGADITTNLMYSKVAIVCDGAMVAEIEPNGDEGNQTVELPNGSIIRYAIYRGLESLNCSGQSCNKAYWNLAFNLEDIEALCGDCRLQLFATASDLTSGEFSGGFPTTPGLAYPYIQVDAPLTVGGAAVCQQNALNECEPLPVGGTVNQCEESWEELLKYAEAVGIASPIWPEDLIEYSATIPCDMSCLEAYAGYVGTFPENANPGPISMAAWATENCVSCAVSTVYHGGLTETEIPQMCWEYSGQDATAIAGVPFPLAWSTAPTLAAAPECAAISANKAAVLLALGDLDPAAQQLNLGAVNPACLPDGALSVASVETSLKLLEVDAGLAPPANPALVLWRFFTPAGNTTGPNLQLYASKETALKALEAFGQTNGVAPLVDVDDRAFVASVETYLKYAEAVGAGALATMATSCGVCGVAASVETWLKYAEAVGVTAGSDSSGFYDRGRTVIASVETFLKYAEAVDLGENLPPCSDCNDGSCHAMASVETFLKYAEALGLTNGGSLCTDINIAASLETYFK